jgi:hypothetical protein
VTNQDSAVVSFAPRKFYPQTLCSLLVSLLLLVLPYLSQKANGAVTAIGMRCFALFCSSICLIFFLLESAAYCCARCCRANAAPMLPPCCRHLSSIPSRHCLTYRYRHLIDRNSDLADRYVLLLAVLLTRFQTGNTSRQSRAFLLRFWAVRS